MSGRSSLFALALLVLLAASAALWFTLRPALGPGPMRLVPAAYADLPGWADGNPAAALDAFRRTCAVIARKPDNAAMGGLDYAGTAKDWRAVCTALPSTPLSAVAARGWFERWFGPVQVFAGDTAEGLFTGYYEPQLRASRRRHGRFVVPVYGRPSDLVTADLGAFRPQWAHQTISGRLEGDRLVPYPSRAEIDAEGLAKAPVLFWAADPVAVFFLQIQGSGRVRLDDGTMLRAEYAGQNGRIYTAVGRTLIKMGALKKEDVSLQSIRTWLLAHPDQARTVMQSDASYVFFKIAPLRDPSLGAEGTEGAPLTPQASLAVDPRLHALGVPVLLATTVPGADGRMRPFDQLLIAQDTGGAITGAVRGDVFWGAGRDAEAIAGRMKSTGTMYLLLPKPLVARLGAGKTFPLSAS